MCRLTQFFFFNMIKAAMERRKQPEKGEEQ